MRFDGNIALSAGQRRGFRPEIESLRGIAALFVAIAHCFVIGLNPSVATFANGVNAENLINLGVHLIFGESGAVILFFVISGYVLGLQIDSLRGPPRQRLSEYYVRRIFRIVPTMWAIVIAIFVLRSTTGMAHGSNWNMLIRTLLFQSSEMDGPLWTIIIEMACSLVFPLLYILNRRGGLTVNIVALAIGYWLMDKWYVPEWTRFIVYFQLGLLVGTAGAAIVRDLYRFAPYVAAGSIAVLCATAATCAALGLDGMIWMRGDAVAAFMLLSFIVSRPDTPLVRLLVTRPAMFLGRISYSLYLLHFVVIEFTISHLGYVVPKAVAASPLAMQTITAVICVPLSICLATLSYRWIEAPSIAFGRNVVTAFRPKTSAASV